MHFSWLWFALVVLISWGVTGVFQKLATNRLSSDTTIALLVFGFLLMQPFLLSSVPLSSYSRRAIIFGLLSGFLNDLGAWGLFEAMKAGGSAGLVTVFTALYPLPVVLLSPFVLGERLTGLQVAGVVCATIAIVLLSREEPITPDVITGAL